MCAGDRVMIFPTVQMGDCVRMPFSAQEWSDDDGEDLDLEVEDEFLGPIRRRLTGGGENPLLIWSIPPSPDNTMNEPSAPPPRRDAETDSQASIENHNEPLLRSAFPNVQEPRYVNGINGVVAPVEHHETGSNGSIENHNEPLLRSAFPNMQEHRNTNVPNGTIVPVEQNGHNLNGVPERPNAPDLVLVNQRPSNGTNNNREYVNAYVNGTYNTPELTNGDGQLVNGVYTNGVHAEEHNGSMSSGSAE